jgi:uncharacterized protein (TIGR03032 family)
MTATGEPAEIPFRYVHTTNFPELLRSLQASLLLTTYQAGKLVLIRELEGRLSTLLRNFEEPMGLVAEPHRLTVGTRRQIWFLHNAPEIAPIYPPAGRHDACFVPRWAHVTGDIHSHDIAWAGSELWIVNTRFSCLSTLHTDYSFVPRWRPKFITGLDGDDRCHLNGLAIDGGLPRYVTALGETDTPEGWRPNKAHGGVLIDVAANAVIARGLSMPHSPRCWAGRLWVLDSGTGRLLLVEPASGRTETVIEFPGYPRGLDFAGPLAFVGLSQVRESNRFGGLPITERLPEPERKCGIWVIDMRTGQVTAHLEFQKGVEEVFAVQFLSGLRFPAVVGLEKEKAQEVFVLPS